MCLVLVPPGKDEKALLSHTYLYTPMPLDTSPLMHVVVVGHAQPPPPPSPGTSQPGRAANTPQPTHPLPPGKF